MENKGSSAPRRGCLLKALLAAAGLCTVSVPMIVIGSLRFTIMDRTDIYDWSCTSSIGAQCSNGACPDPPGFFEYEGEYEQTMKALEFSIRGMAWKPDFATPVRYAYKRYEHFLRNQDNYSLSNTDFFPSLWGVDLDASEDWDISAYLAKDNPFKDRLSFVNALLHDTPPPSAFPKWFHRWMMGSMIFDRLATGKDPYAGKYVNNREIGLRFFAPIPLCNEAAQLALIEAAPSCPEKEARQFRLAVHALSDSANELAIDTLLKLCYKSCMEPAESCETATTKRSRFLRRLIQVGYLRLGEVSNCQKRHTSESCIFPLSEKAVHVDKGPAGELMRWLDMEPDDDQHTKWLKVIAAMQLGTYDELPDDIKFPESIFETKSTVRRFKNIAGPLGLDLWGGTGAIAGDDFVGDDGLIDFYQQTALQWPRGQRAAYMKRNAGNGSFMDISFETKLVQGPSGNIGKQADYDNDGDLDIFNGRGGWMSILQLPNSLYQNVDGVFYEVTRSSGDSLTGEKGTHSAAWVDFDLDGHLDLYVASEQNPCELFRNNGDKTFTEIAGKMGVAECGWVKGVAWGYLDSDDYPDLVVSSIAGNNQVYLNRGGNYFEDIALRANATGPRFSQPVAVVDIDNDGDDDIVYGAHRPPDPGELYAIYSGEPWDEQYIMDRRGLGDDSGLTQILLNRGDATFEDASARTDKRLLTSGVMAMNFGDIDNDGYVDFYLGTGWPDLRGLMPNIMLHNNKDGSFIDATFVGGFGHLQKGHGISFVDIQNDGNLDVAASMGGALTGDMFADALYLNPGHENNWIKISLIGHKSNRFGQGAKLILQTADGEVLYSVVGNAASFGSNPVKIHHVGLGKSTLSKLTVRWPHKDVPPQTIEKDLPTNAWIEIEEGMDGVRLRELRTFNLDADQLIEQFEAGGHCHHHDHHHMIDPREAEDAASLLFS